MITKFLLSTWNGLLLEKVVRLSKQLHVFMFVRVATNEGVWTPPQTPPARPVKAEQTAWESVRPSRELHVFVFVEASAINGLQEVALRHSLDTCTHYASESNSGLEG